MLTVGELIKELEQYNEDLPVFVDNYYSTPNKVLATRAKTIYTCELTGEADKHTGKIHTDCYSDFDGVGRTPLDVVVVSEFDE